MSYIVLMRNPRGGKLLALRGCTDEDETDGIAEFQGEVGAEAAAFKNSMCQAWGYRIIEIESE